MPDPTPRVRYRYAPDAALDAADVVLPTGRTVTVRRGDHLDALPGETAALDALPDFTRDPGEEPDPA